MWIAVNPQDIISMIYLQIAARAEKELTEPRDPTAGVLKICLASQ
jgi:hypothetical protein